MIDDMINEIINEYRLKIFINNIIGRFVNIGIRSKYINTYRNLDSEILSDVIMRSIVGSENIDSVDKNRFYLFDVVKV